MKTDKEKYYLLKLNYEVVDLNAKKKKRRVRKSKRTLLVKDLENIDSTLLNLEQEFEGIENDNYSNAFSRILKKLKRFGAGCNRTYYNVLHT